MLGFLRGTVLARLDQRILVEVCGVGYWVQTGSWQPEGETSCYLHHHVREEASDLYGFPDLATLALFEKLLGVSGIGPKAALSLLSIGSPERLAQAIAAADASFLSSAPGVGSKAAQKIILELRGKVGALTADGKAEEAALASHQDVILALESLGYKAADVRDLVKAIPAELTALDARLKWTLQQLAGGR